MLQMHVGCDSSPARLDQYYDLLRLAETRAPYQTMKQHGVELCCNAFPIARPRGILVMSLALLLTARLPTVQAMGVGVSGLSRLCDKARSLTFVW